MPNYRQFFISIVTISWRVQTVSQTLLTTIYEIFQMNYTSMLALDATEEWNGYYIWKLFHTCINSSYVYDYMYTDSPHKGPLIRGLVSTLLLHYVCRWTTSRLMWFKTPWPSCEPFWHQAIIQTNAGMLSIRNINGNSNIFIKNVFENVLCEMAAILTRPQSVNVI